MSCLLRARHISISITISSFQLISTIIIISAHYLLFPLSVSVLLRLHFLQELVERHFRVEANDGVLHHAVFGIAVGVEQTSPASPASPTLRRVTSLRFSFRHHVGLLLLQLRIVLLLRRGDGGRGRGLSSSGLAVATALVALNTVGVGVGGLQQLSTTTGRTRASTRRTSFDFAVAFATASAPVEEVALALRRGHFGFGCLP